MKGTIGLKRIYEPKAGSDGQRVLVDRVWPRGVGKQAAALDLWLKNIAPSTALRKWFGHDPARFGEFRERYRHELDANCDAVAELCDLADRGDVTLLYAAHDERHNQAVVLAEYLSERGMACGPLAESAIVSRWSAPPRGTGQPRPAAERGHLR